MGEQWHASRNPTLNEIENLLRNGSGNDMIDFISWFKHKVLSNSCRTPFRIKIINGLTAYNFQARNDGSMSLELRQVAKGCAYRVRSFNAYDVNGYRFHTTSYEESRPNRRTTNTGVFTPGVDGVEYYGRVEEIYELTFEGSKPLNPVIFKCHWFDPAVVRRTPNLGLVEVQRSSVYSGDDVYIVAQQATQVYYLSYPCQTDDHLIGWDVVYKISPHGILPIPNDADYNIDPSTDEVEFFQDDGLEGTFEIDLTEAFEMEVENERVVDDDVGDEVHNAKDIQLLERLNLGNDVDDDMPPSEHGHDYVDMSDSDDEDYDLANPGDNDDEDDYF